MTMRPTPRASQGLSEGFPAGLRLEPPREAARLSARRPPGKLPGRVRVPGYTHPRVGNFQNLDMPNRSRLTGQVKPNQP